MIVYVAVHGSIVVGVATTHEAALEMLKKINPTIAPVSPNRYIGLGMEDFFIYPFHLKGA